MKIIMRIYRLVVRTVLAWQQWRCERARAYLLRHDFPYRSAHIGHEIVRRREELYSAGVSPSDPRVPDLWTLEAELPPMSWPHGGNNDRP